MRCLWEYSFERSETMNEQYPQYPPVPPHYPPQYPMPYYPPVPPHYPPQYPVPQAPPQPTVIINVGGGGGLGDFVGQCLVAMVLALGIFLLLLLLLGVL